MLKLSALLIGAVFLLAACEDDGDGTDADPDTATATVTTTTDATTAPTTTATTDTTVGTATATATGTTTTGATGDGSGETVEVSGVDYAFEGVPETVEAGTQFTFTNQSEVEFHELILFQLPEGETRTVDELLLLPDEEAESLVGEPVGVSVAMPGEEGMVLEGELVAQDPGRYIMLCFIPTGADPQAFAEAMENSEGGPPEVEGGPPHVAQGMYAEFTVE